MQPRPSPLRPGLPLAQGLRSSDAGSYNGTVITQAPQHSTRPGQYQHQSGSWLNAVESFFTVPTRKRIRRGSFHSLVDLQATIKRYLAQHNAGPKPFTWTASATSILAKLDRLPEQSIRAKQ